jgi:hypothetical protein
MLPLKYQVFDAATLFPAYFHTCVEVAKAKGYAYISFNGMVFKTTERVPEFKNSLALYADLATLPKGSVDRHEIWCEGDAEEKAHWFGIMHSKTFKDACIMLFGENSEKFNLTEMTYCGRNLFDNESEARASFG